MHRVFRSAAVAWGAAGVLACTTVMLSWLHRQEPTAAGGPTPRWVLPQERARALARSQARPLLLVSLNGNLDGYC